MKLHQAAREHLASADDAYREALLSSLRSANAYERRLALERFGQMRHLLDARVAVAIVPVLAETEKLQSEMCASLIARLRRSYGGQGEELQYASCQYDGGTSNGALAGALIGSGLLSEQVVSAIAAFVRDRPAAVEGVIASLGGSASTAARAALAALPSANDPLARVALLRLAVAGACGSITDLAGLEPAILLLSARESTVARSAALALLRSFPLGNAFQTLAKIGAPAASAKASVLRRLNDGRSTARAEGLMALARMYVKLDRDEFAR